MVWASIHYLLFSADYDLFTQFEESAGFLASYAIAMAIAGYGTATMVLVFQVVFEIMLSLYCIHVYHWYGIAS